ncbi:hypothetical protein SAMN02745181_0455 [Rubritalea squalenifaciens DSM 18772]|uniref:Transcription factor zinc-finger domain-containing protein n=2 Tax=Rubritalea TaxID=361050 RepID=A0A1M6CEJ5_9BACT|nr:zf-TFIIB domain-containing protein [Rubritalea squalenifaciens]SHI59194.1 hypothetical protein SAMN02745181_0455 [Rubritalea squalenifaciens DSM 18772]
MNCPKCMTPLTIGSRNDVEIDYCQKCRGIWLDAGELDKILDRSGRHQVHRDGQHEDDRKESWWERVIDIFD